CLVAAGTLIAEGKRIPPRSVVMGVPGKVVREVTDEDLAGIRSIAEHYFEMARRHARGGFRRPWQQERAGWVKFRDGLLRRSRGVTAESLIHPPSEGVGFAIDLVSDRRADIEVKQGRIAAMLREAGQEGLLLLEPENFAWFTSG